MLVQEAAPLRREQGLCSEAVSSPSQEGITPWARGGLTAWRPCPLSSTVLQQHGTQERDGDPGWKGATGGADQIWGALSFSPAHLPSKGRAMSLLRYNWSSSPWELKVKLDFLSSPRAGRGPLVPSGGETE